MEQHTLGAGFYAVTVGVCKTNRILYDPIDKTIEIPAELDPDGRECVFPPGQEGGLYPGVRCGGMWIIRPRDAKTQEKK